MNSKLMLTNAAVRTSNDNKPGFSLQTWHWALLIGVPSTALVSYLLYKNFYASQQAKQQPKSIKSQIKQADTLKSAASATAEKKEKKPKVKFCRFQ
jgi:hypothetical protein